MGGRKTLVGFLMVAMFLGGCGRDRPAAADWREGWDRVTAAIPQESALSGDGADEACEEALAFLRSNRADLLPSPDLAVDDAVTSWFAIAEDAFFECPPQNEQIGSFPEAFAELAVLEAEIEAALQMRDGS